MKGEGNQQDYGERIYDPRLGRFLSVDPLGRKYPELTPYQFASNTPIQAVDLDGLEAALLSYGYRVTAVFITGSLSIGAGVDIKGNVKLFYTWSAGLGLGAFAGGGLTASFYPTATLKQVMGEGINIGGNVGIPGVSIGLDINVSPQTNDANKYTGSKVGVSGGVKLGSLGPGGAEVHVDYSNTTPFFEFNIVDDVVGAYNKVKETVPSLSDESIRHFLGYITNVQSSLKQMSEEQSPSNQPQQPKAATDKKSSLNSNHQKQRLPLKIKGLIRNRNKKMIQ